MLCSAQLPSLLSTQDVHCSGKHLGFFNSKHFRVKKNIVIIMNMVELVEVVRIVVSQFVFIWLRNQ